MQNRDAEVALDELDGGGLLQVQVEEGSHGVLVTGTTGEPSLLTVAERIRLFELAVRTIRGRVPVVAAPGGQSLADTLEMASVPQLNDVTEAIRQLHAEQP